MSVHKNKAHRRNKVGKDGSFNPSGGLFCGKFVHLRPLPKLDVYSEDRFVNCNKLMTCGS